MHFVEVGACQGLKPKAHPKHLRGAEAPLFRGKTALVAFFSNLLGDRRGWTEASIWNPCPETADYSFSWKFYEGSITLLLYGVSQNLTFDFRACRGYFFDKHILSIHERRGIIDYDIKLVLEKSR
jgi:hypothetical protein